MLGACAAPPPAIGTPRPTPERGVLAVTALLDLSGPGSAIGTAERDALRSWLHDRKGKTAFPVRIRTVDTAGSEARLFIELRRATVEEPADAVIVGAPAVYDDVLGRALDVAALPVLFTLPLGSDPAASLGGRWAFALAPTLRRLAAAEISDAVRRDALAPSRVLTGAQDRIDPLAGALEADLASRGLGPIERVPLPADGGVPIPVHVALPDLRSVHCTALPASCVPIARAAQAARTGTLFYLSYLTTTRDLEAHPVLAQRAIWPSSRTILPFSAPPVTAVDQARDAFLHAFGGRYGTAGAHAATAYDAASLLYAAAARAGPGDRVSLRDALERITMPLIATTYSFAPDRHAGSDPDDLAYVRWTGSALAPAPAPALGTGVATPTPSPTRPVSPSRTPSASPAGTP